MIIRKSGIKFLDPRITIGFRDQGKYVNIQIGDGKSRLDHLHLIMTAEQFARALGGLLSTSVAEAVLYSPERVGTTMEVSMLEFEVPEEYGFGYSADKAKLADLANTLCQQDGWTPDTSFNSRDSFFQKDGKPYARTTIRRWVQRIG